MKKLLIVTDAQNSFINEHTAPVLEKIDALVRSQRFDAVIFTQFGGRNCIMTAALRTSKNVSQWIQLAIEFSRSEAIRL